MVRVIDKEDALGGKGSLRTGLLPLSLLNRGESAAVVEIAAGRQMRLRVEDIGIREGKVVEVLDNERHSPILIKIDDSRIAIGRGMAMRIMVKRL